MDIANLIIGLCGVVGTAISLLIALRARSTAKSAEKAANAALETVLRGISISDLIRAHANIEELKRLHRAYDIDQAIHEYTPLRQFLTDIQANLPEEQWEMFDMAIEDLMEMESDIDEAISSDKQSEIDTTAFNSTLVDIQQMLDDVRVSLERRPTNISDTGD